MRRITTGFRPTVQPPLVFQPVEHEGRVIFLDHNHEIFVPLDGKRFSISEEFISKVTKEDNNSVRVDLIKKSKSGR